jgi:flagellin-like protein
MCASPRRFAAADRGASEVVGTLLMVAIVVLVVSGAGAVVLSDRQAQADATEPDVRVDGDVDASLATLTHQGGGSVPLSDLELVLRSGGSETRYALDNPAVNLTGDGDDVFEGGESVNVSNPYGGTVRLLLYDTADPTRVLYDEGFRVGGSDDDPSPVVKRFDINDTSSDGNASYDVTWRVTDPTGDLTSVQVELADLGTDTVVDSDSASFAGVGDTGVQTSNFTNTSGAGESYVLRIRATDAAGNTGSELSVDTADSEPTPDLRSPVIRSFSVTDTSGGQDASYDVTYNATDADGDLTSVELELIDDDTGTVLASNNDTYPETNVTGEVTRTLSYTGGKSKGETYRINITATDATGRTDVGSVTDVVDGEGGGGGGAAAPDITQFDVEDGSVCGNRAIYDVTWAVEDTDGLDSVLVEVIRTKNGKQVASQSYDVTGQTSASGSVSLEPNGNRCGEELRVSITATDPDGNMATDSWTDTADGTGKN